MQIEDDAIEPSPEDQEEFSYQSNDDEVCSIGHERCAMTQLL